MYSIRIDEIKWLIVSQYSNNKSILADFGLMIITSTGMRVKQCRFISDPIPMYLPSMVQIVENMFRKKTENKLNKLNGLDVGTLMKVLKTTGNVNQFSKLIISIKVTPED